jgi:hypothetical protein
MSWHPSHLTPAQPEARRLAAGRLLRAGRLSQAEIARAFGVSRAGHRDVSTTMIYTHVVNREGRGVRSPADRLGVRVDAGRAE